MKINPEDNFLPYMTIVQTVDDESKARLEEDANAHYGNPWELSIRDFFALAENDFSYIGLDSAALHKASVRQFVWLKEFHDICAQIVLILKRLQVPESADSKRASAQCLKVTSKESAIVFARRYFGLHSFTEAENITIADFIVARKDEYNRSMYQYCLTEIQRKKMTKV